MTKLDRNIIYSLPIISICFEIVKSFITSPVPIMSVRNYLCLLIILYLTIKYFKYVLKFNVFLFIIAIYFFILLIFQGAKINEYNDWVQFMDAKMLLPLSFILTSSYGHIKQLQKRFLIINILFVLSIFIFSAFGIGWNQYGTQSGFRAGVFTHSAIYIGSYLLLTYPAIYSDLRSKIWRNALIIMGFLTLVILVLSVRRSALVIVFIGVVVYVYLYKSHLSRIVLYAFAFFVLLVVSYPLYQETLEKQIAARGDVFNEKAVTENLQEETRLAETVAVYEERILTHDINLLLFGDYLFQSARNYAGGIHGDRPIHLDINIVLHGAGLIGLILFLLIWIQLFFKFYFFKTKLNIPNEKNLKGAFVAMFLSHLFLLISGGMNTITFNMISSLYMGGILGLYRSAHLGILNPVIARESKVAEPQWPLKPKPFIYEATERNYIN